MSLVEARAQCHTLLLRALSKLPTTTLFRGTLPALSTEACERVAGFSFFTLQSWFITFFSGIFNAIATLLRRNRGRRGTLRRNAKNRFLKDAGGADVAFGTGGEGGFSTLFEGIGSSIATESWEGDAETVTTDEGRISSTGGCHGVTLANVASLLCRGDLSSRVVVLLPFFSQFHVLPERPVHACEADISPILLAQPETNLLTAPAVFSADPQDELCGNGIDTPALTMAFAFLHATFKGTQSLVADAFHPSIDCHAFHAQLLRNAGNGYPILPEGKRMFVDTYVFHVTGGKVANVSHYSAILSHLK